MVNRTEPLLHVRGISRRFGSGPAEVSALRDVDVTIRAGDFTVVLGASGSGKSTLLNIIGGMDRPTAGSVVADGTDLTQLSDRRLTDYRRTRVGFVFQFYNLVPNLTALENVALAASLVMPSADASALADELLTGMGLGHRLSQFPRNLSGGEMQRVAIARALAKRPPLLLCDEPSGALDSVTGQNVLAKLQRTARDTGTAVVVVTHDSSLAEAADHLIRLADGRVIIDEHNPAPVPIRPPVTSGAAR